MSNEYFTDTLGLEDFTRARAAPLNGLSAQIEAAFDLIPDRDVMELVIKPTVVATGTANAIVVTNAVPVTSYALGQRISFKAIAANTGATTVNVDGLGAKSIIRGDGTALIAGDIASGSIIDAIYDGTNFRIQGTIVLITPDGIDLATAEAQAARDAAEAAAASADASADAAAAAMAPYTAADVLSKLITVDGSGSGVDADLVRSTTPSATGLSILSAASATAVKSTLSLGNVDNTSDANKPISTATQSALDAKAPIANPTFTGTGVTLPGDPVSDLHAASKGWVNTSIAGLTNEKPKTAVACVAVSNITLSGEQTIDGVLTSASRVLVTGQSTASQNGIYVSAAGAWSRATDTDTWAELEYASVLVSGGTSYSGSSWTQTAVGGTLGSTAITWAQRSIASSYTASDGITKTSLNFALSPIATARIMGNNSGSSAAPTALTATAVTAMLDVFGTAKGLVPAVVSATGAKYLADDGGFDGTITPQAVAASGTVTGSNLSGTNTGDQTITLTGDVTGSGTGSFAATIASGAVSLAKMANVATGTVFYRKTAGTGSPEVQTLATLKSDLDLSGTNTGDQTTVSGNAGSATVLQTARTIATSGGATGTATSFDGSANITIAITALDLSYASAGTLPVARGGTGTTTSTGTGNVVLSASPTFSGLASFTSLEFLGVSRGPSGSATTPAFSFSADNNTGIFSSAADTLDFTTGGTSRVTLSTTSAAFAVPISGTNVTTSGIVSLAAGTVSAPSLTFTGDTNTGIYSSAADKIDFATGGTNRLSLASTGLTSTVVHLAPDGAVGAPGYSFANDPDTGIYSSAANALAIACGGAQRLNINSTSMTLNGIGLVCGTGKTINIPSPTVPGTAGATGSAGDISWDSSYIYVCVATNTWKRAALSTW